MFASFDLHCQFLFKCLANECFFDSLRNRALNPSVPFGISYRPLKYRLVNQLPFAGLVLLFVWPVISLFYFLHLFVRSCVESLFSSELPPGNGASLWLSSGARSDQIYCRYASLVHPLRVSLSSFSLARLVSLSRICRVFVSAFIFSAFIFPGSYPFQLPNSLSAFNLLLIHDFLGSLSPNCIVGHCQQSDRLAIAISSFKFSGSHVWQHGFFRTDQPVKLAYVSDLHFFSREMAISFMSIISSRCHPTIHSPLVTPREVLVDHSISPVCILLISSPKSFNREFDFIQYVCSGNSASVFPVGVKSHPTYGCNHLLRLECSPERKPYVFTSKSGTVPPADLYFSFSDSFLLYELVSAGMNTLSAGSSDSNDLLLNKILKRLSSF